MSKVFKSIGKAVSKVGKFIKKNWKTMLAVAAVVFTAGAAMGAWGLGGGVGGWAGVKAAWTNLAAGIGTKIKALWGGGKAAAGAGVPIDASAAASTGLEGLSVNIPAAAEIGSAPVVLPAPVAGAGAAQTAAAGVAKAFLMSPGGGIVTATGLNMAGGYYQQKAAEEQAAKEKDQFMRENVAYGYDRYGNKSSTYQPIDWSKIAGAPQITGAGLMAPSVQTPQVAGPAGGYQAQQPVAQSMLAPRVPQTLDELIQERSRTQQFNQQLS